MIKKKQTRKRSERNTNKKQTNINTNRQEAEVPPVELKWDAAYCKDTKIDQTGTIITHQKSKQTNTTSKHETNTNTSTNHKNIQ